MSKLCGWDKNLGHLALTLGCQLKANKYAGKGFIASSNGIVGIREFEPPTYLSLLPKLNPLHFDKGIFLELSKEMTVVYFKKSL